MIMNISGASVPRASGDKPAKTALENSINMCSPRQRG
ncbi:hypothetical protein SEEA9517_20067 [Salmonella enterica subsp. enterica serovar Agona str. 400095 17]|nr:hypothetical protein SEEACDC5_03592 [Salmonella enterica subsp. enterica serovar Agona str. SA-5]ESB89280.1 hypothetical protein SEEAA707_19097 [Salmonella enterica subsp. enterica serovar Agona str. ATCC BAA-707]ESB98801.1 hypothetical protein SEPB61_21982 [Salmonella enterica subsp. enterica serovar Paratyphi B str. SARA61]ESH95129.1 hypothetical protein SEEA1957_11920 [Salmonella enterica subsp. enterica serovar Agona str. ATCC 51957]ESO19029.1 hypothetical protein SEEA9514_01571 [Salmone